ncbi:MAG: hypothetical protein RL368_2301 [Pseudomonadota bacterium]|jgi:hypothetical protein
MSYLDALRQASEQQKAAEIEESARLEKLQARFQKEVKPALEILYAGINELVQHLNYLKTTTPVEYHIKGCQNAVELAQQGYILTIFRELQLLNQRNFKNKAADTTKDNDFSLCFKAIGHKSIRFEKVQALETQLQRDYLEEFNLEFKLKESLDQQGNVLKTLFLVEPVIPMEFRFTNDLENSVIDLSITNFTELGQKVYLIKPEEVTSAFVDELAKYLNRQPNKLALKLKPMHYGKLTARVSKPALPTASPAAPKTTALPKAPIQKEPEQDLEEFQKWLSAQVQKIESEQEAKKAPAPKGLFGGLFSKMGLGRAK